MSDPLLIAMFTAIPGAIAALGTFVGIVIGLKNHEADVKNHENTSGRITELTVRVNGRLDELLSSAKDSGRVAEASEQHARDAAKGE